MYLPNTTVIESPKKRYYKRLTEKYEAKWILDLHNEMGSYDPQMRYHLATLFPSSRYKPEVDEERITKLRNWVRQTYDKSPRGTYPINVIDADPLLGKPSNIIGVELYPHNSFRKSLEFLEKFTKFLYVSNF